MKKYSQNRFTYIKQVFINKIQMASNLIKQKTLLQALIILSLFILQLFAQVGLTTKCSAIDERLDAFKTLTGISALLFKKQKFSTLFGTCSLKRVL